MFKLAYMLMFGIVASIVMHFADPHTLFCGEVIFNNTHVQHERKGDAEFHKYCARTHAPSPPPNNTPASPPPPPHNTHKHRHRQSFRSIFCQSACPFIAVWLVQTILMANISGGVMLHFTRECKCNPTETHHLSILVRGELYITTLMSRTIEYLIQCALLIYLFI